VTKNSLNGVAYYRLKKIDHKFISIDKVINNFAHVYRFFYAFQAISSSVCQSVGLDTHGVCSTGVTRDEQPCIGAEADSSNMITVLSR